MAPSGEETGTGPSWAVVGNPDNRRVRLFAEAVRQAGGAPPRLVPWREVLREGGADFGPEELVRLDSPGEDPEVDHLLRGVDDPTRVEGTARWYANFLRAVASLRGGRRLDEPAELQELFDKRRCHARLAEADVPVPFSPTSAGPDAPPVRDWSDVRTLMRDAGVARFFVKPAHGSSASGVLAVETAGAGRIRATTSVERAPDGRLYNSLRLSRLTREREIGALVDRLTPDGLHLERWWPKGSLDGGAADLRVVVVAGRATHAVVRTSRGPMTNLHLGGRRGDLARARAAAGDHWAEALAVCERAAARFPGTLCVGVDLLPSTDWRRFAVGEVNAFGDLLPGLTGLPGGGAEGRDTYAAQVAAASRFRAGAPTPSAAARWAPDSVHPRVPLAPGRSRRSHAPA
ncbi:STM4014 family protein [Streptomyces sp. NPDC005438]|uniref:STM4014 family protein n=1 Tax=Streptomyces sp. NPDC005438 TaxID=3156880 RepID=UPI0033A5F877